MAVTITMGIIIKSLLVGILLAGIQVEGQPTPHVLRCKPHILPPGLANEILKALPSSMGEAAKMLQETLRSEAENAQSMRRFGRNGGSQGSFRFVQAFLGGTLHGKRMSYPAFLQTKALKFIKTRFRLKNTQIRELMSCMPALLKEYPTVFHPDTRPVVPRADYCPYPRQVACKAHEIYRTYDGCCNSIQHPLWGASHMPLSRYIPPDYSDAIEGPRRAKDGSYLPSARLVSSTIHWDIDLPHHVHTLMVMQMGQFIDHDLSRTAISKLSSRPLGDLQVIDDLEDVECGRNGCQTRGPENYACMPIHVPRNDSDFGGKPCLMFVRSQGVPNPSCKMGPREQLNQVTSLLDGSLIYGSTIDDAMDLRDLSDSRRGRMKVTPHPRGRRYKDLLPKDPKFKHCMFTNRNIKCFKAGDGRVNEFVGLTTLHTMFIREHNSIERHLFDLNPHWHGERLYQETRRIMVGMWQNMVYSEFLPVVLGDRLMDKYGLKLEEHGYWNGYDEDVNPTVTNSFATAAFRFGHTLIQGFVHTMDNDYNTDSVMPISVGFRNPRLIYNLPHKGFDPLVRGLCGMNMQTKDSFITKQVTRHLFSEDPPEELGEDLASLNIQRAREHGLPGYNYYREWCGLSRARTWSDLDGVMPPAVLARFKRLYKHVDDIDLFPAGISEYSMKGALLGPTLGCLIGNQFRALKFGDRFWFENNRHNPYSFNPAQMMEMKKITFSKIICDNSDSIKQIQPKIMMQPMSQVFKNMREQNKLNDLENFNHFYFGSQNERLPCGHLPGMDLRAWQEHGASLPPPGYDEGPPRPPLGPPPGPQHRGPPPSQFSDNNLPHGPPPHSMREFSNIIHAGPAFRSGKDLRITLIPTKSQPAKFAIQIQRGKLKR